MIIVISFILDNLVSSLINFNSLMYPLFSILSLILIYPYFNKTDNSYYTLSFILGLLYDIAYTNTLFLNAFIFLLLSYILKSLFKKLPYNYLSILILSVITIIYYRVFTYIILIIVNYFEFDFLYLLKGIYSSLIMNIIYVTLIYLIINLKKLILKNSKKHKRMYKY